MFLGENKLVKDDKNIFYIPVGLASLLKIKCSSFCDG